MSKPRESGRDRQRKPEDGRRRVRGPYALGGCFTCRRRHVKCDQVKPTCLTCRACGVACEGFSSDLRWVGSSSSRKSQWPSDPSKSSRRQLYTEKSRELMAAAISSSVSSNSVGTALSDIDDHLNSTSSKTLGITIGPFGVFDSNPGPDPAVTASLRSSIDADGQDIHTGEELQLLHPFAYAPNAYYHELSLIDEYGDGSLSGSWDGYLAWTDLFALDFETSLGLPPAPGSMDLEPLGQNTLASQTPDEHERSKEIFPSRDQSRMPAGSLPCHSLSESQPGSVDWRSPKIAFLLRHFFWAVIPRMASVPLEKKYAWGPMNHELAVHTLAEVTYLEKADVNEAKLANLCAIVAISSYHLYIMRDDAHQPPEDWLRFSRKVIRDADVHLNRSLESETRGPKAAKYKEQLMAVQALMAYAWATADTTEARRYQLETERLVRFRGLAKRDISRRIRLLHHAYTWNRIVGESTYVLHDYRKFRHAISASFGEPQISDRREVGTAPNQTDTNQARENTRLDDFLRIGNRFEEIGRSLEGQKDAQTGNQDIHLEDPRNSAEDGFHVIYGVPERWLSLLSRTTRLANWLDASEIPEKLGGSRLSETLERRAQSLEDAICAFVGSTDGPADIDANEPPNVCMFRCLTVSLLIFFYRRIRNVHPLVLQSHVDEVIQGLDKFDASLVRHQQPGPGSAWAAFMAGCEAMGEVRREKFRQWMDRAFDSSKFELYRRGKELMSQVWEYVDQTQGRSHGALRRPTWMQVSRDSDTWIVLN